MRWLRLTMASGWYVTLLMSIAYVVCFIDRALVSVAGVPIKRDLGLSDSQFGLLNGTAFVLLYCLCGVPLGWLADRMDRRLMIAVGMLFWTLMTAACGLAGSAGMFFAARVGVGLGEASLMPAATSLLGNAVPPHQRTRAVAVFLMGAAIGNGAALLGGGEILARLTPAGLTPAGQTPAGQTPAGQTPARPVALPFVGSCAPWQLLFLLACLPGLIVAALVMTIREPARPPPGRRQAGHAAAAFAHIAAHLRAYALLAGSTACLIVLSL